MDSLKADNLTSGFYAVMSQDEGAWAGIKNVDLTNATKFTLSVASKDSAGDIEIHLDSPTGPLIAVAEVPVTSPVTYDLEGSDVSVTELGYVNVDANIQNSTGVRDVYIVFGAPELRVATLSANYYSPSGDDGGSTVPSPTPTPTPVTPCKSVRCKRTLG